MVTVAPPALVLYGLLISDTFSIYIPFYFTQRVKKSQGILGIFGFFEESKRKRPRRKPQAPEILFKRLLSHICAAAVAAGVILLQKGRGLSCADRDANGHQDAQEKDQQGFAQLGACSFLVLRLIFRPKRRPRLREKGNEIAHWHHPDHHVHSRRSFWLYPGNKISRSCSFLYRSMHFCLSMISFSGFLHL